MADLIELIEDTAEKLGQLDSGTESATQAVQELTSEIESLSAELAAGLENLVERSSRLMERTETSEQA